MSPKTKNKIATASAEAGGSNDSDLALIRRKTFLDKPNPGKLTAWHKNKIAARNPCQARDIGTFLRFLDLPLDVFFEIVVYVEILDIIHLSQVSRRYHSLLMSQKFRSIWITALRSHPGLPACPPDLSEPQYAALVFGSTCNACGNEQAYRVCASLRFRFCEPCSEENLVIGNMAQRRLRFSNVVFKLCPQVLTVSAHEQDKKARNNAAWHQYYKPEIEHVVGRLNQMTNPMEKDKFIEERQTLTDRLQEHGYEIMGWIKQDQAAKEKVEQERIKKVRKAEIRRRVDEELLAIGWRTQLTTTAEETNPIRWSNSLDELLDDAFWENDDRGRRSTFWNIAKSQKAVMATVANLEVIIVDSNRHLTHSIIRELFERFLGQCGLAIEELLELPVWSAFCQLPALSSLIQRGPIPDSPEWPYEFSAALIEARATRELVNLLRAAHPDYIELPDDYVLSRASSLFRSRVSYSPGRIYAFPEILAEVLKSEGGTIAGVIDCEPVIACAANLILRTAELPENSDCDAVKSLDGRVMCLCGHPNFQEPMTFLGLVEHIVYENEWFNNLMAGEGDNLDPSIELHNDHDLTGFEPLALVVLPIEDQMLPSHTLSPEKNETVNAKLCCSLCYRWREGTCVSFGQRGPESAYHVQAKHKRTAKRGDLVPWSTLSDRKQ